MSNAERAIQFTMTVGDLKDILEQFDDNLPVVLERNSGDYWNTPVVECIEDGGSCGPMEHELAWSEYHRQLGPHVPSEYDEEDDTVETVKAVVLNCPYDRDL